MHGKTTARERQTQAKLKVSAADTVPVHQGHKPLLSCVVRSSALIDLAFWENINSVPYPHPNWSLHCGSGSLMHLLVQRFKNLHNFGIFFTVFDPLYWKNDKWMRSSAKDFQTTAAKFLIFIFFFIFLFFYFRLLDEWSPFSGLCRVTHSLPLVTSSDTFDINITLLPLRVGGGGALWVMSNMCRNLFVRLGRECDLEARRQRTG